MDILNTLLEITIYSAVIYAVVMLIKKLLGKKLSPALHYAIWALLVIRLMMPFTVDSGIQLIQIPGQQAPAQQTAQQQAPLTSPESPDYGAARHSAAEDGAVPAKQHSTATVPTAEQPSAQTATPTTNAPLLSVDSILLGVWLAGAAASLTYMLVSYAVLRKRLRHGMVAVADDVTALFEQCKNEMGIRRPLRIAGVSRLGTPALVVPSMVLMPAELAGAMDSRRLEFALRHELTHYKRKDHFVNMLLLVLQAIYWFNPFVWLALRQMRTDMEVACDNAVTRRLKGDEKSAYAGMIVSMFTAMKREQLVLGMALGHSKKVAEKRVRGVFASGRSRRSAVLVSVMMAALLLLTCFTTACQPTPTEPFVQTKDNDTVQQAIESSQPDSTAEIHRYSAPETWQSQVSDEAKKVGINVDAQVTVPTDMWSLYQLVEIEPDKAYVDRILNALIGDAKIYGEDTYLSRDELMEQLTEIEKRMADVQQREDSPARVEENPQGGGKPESVPAYNKADEITYLEDWKEQVTAALQNAPDEQTDVIVDIDTSVLFSDTSEAATSSYYNPSGQQSVTIGDGFVEIAGLADIGGADPARINMSRTPAGAIRIGFQIGCGGNGGFGSREPLDSEPLTGITVSQDEAADMARQAVQSMGFDYLDIAATQKMSVYNSNTGAQTECYAFTFTRSLDGALATYAYGSSVVLKTIEELNAYAEEYARQWRVDEVVVGVDDSGVVYADINVPKTSVTQLAQGVELKDFSEIMEIFNRQAIIEGCFSPVGISELVVGRSVNVDEIRLGYMPTIWKDHPNEIIFVPVWDFFGSETTTYDENYEKKESSDLYASLDENYQRTDDLGSQAILTINAMDGTIMKRMSGEG